ncbi:MAG: hypothetical protein M1542_07175 [Thermotogae bacterium]|nr:hypothetical protein [Thermotogota bacterium]
MDIPIGNYKMVRTGEYHVSMMITYKGDKNSNQQIKTEITFEITQDDLVRMERQSELRMDSGKTFVGKRLYLWRRYNSKLVRRLSFSTPTVAVKAATFFDLQKQLIGCTIYLVTSKQQMANSIWQERDIRDWGLETKKAAHGQWPMAKTKQ